MFEVIGHRGAGILEHENTIESFIKAREIGCRRIEFDIHLTKDQKAVIIHDSNLTETAGINGEVGDFTHSELKHIKIKDRYRIPELEELFSLFKNSDMTFQIELKGEGSETVVSEIVERFKLEERVRYTSFVHKRVKKALELNPGAEGGILMCSLPIDPASLVKECGAAFLHISKWNISADLVKDLHAEGIGVVGWENIVNEDDFRLLVECGADGATTDRPDLFLGFLNMYQTGS